MQVIHTAGAPPNVGRSMRATIGSTQKRRAALKKRVVAKSRSVNRCARASASMAEQ
jgi:hypothetical protein